MMRQLSFKAHGRKYIWKPSKPCHVGIYWVALAEYSKMSTHVPGFRSFFIFFASFCNSPIRPLAAQGLKKSISPRVKLFTVHLVKTWLIFSYATGDYFGRYNKRQTT